MALRKVSSNLIANQSPTVPVMVYLGVDRGDPFLCGEENEGFLRQDIFSRLEVKILVFEPTSPVKICSIWRSLAEEAMRDKCKYFILFGDDVDVKTTDGAKWPEAIHRHFTTGKTPFFGCLALNDLTSPGFPTFPVVTDVHMQIFSNKIIPEEFVNQDGDPYLFALYRRFGSSRFATDISLTNSVGGVQLLEDEGYLPPRYERHHIDWRGEMLQRGVSRISEWIREEADEATKSLIEACFVLDIVVPSFRVKSEFLLPIIHLNAPKTCDHMVIVIIDDPDADITWLRELEKSEPLLGRLRVRKNTSNRGAPISRNVGLNEASSDWVLFLDDDVVPDHQLLYEYMKAVEEYGSSYDGFVGVTHLPDDSSNGLFATAVHLSGVSFFWTCASQKETTPWGITANFLFHRTCSNHNLPPPNPVPRISSKEWGNNTRVRFDDTFIKTGGGEDIDFCLRLCRQPMKCVPGAICHHPWWRSGQRCYEHFYGWAYGDSLLIDKHPHFSYYNYPNVVEFSVLLMFFYGFIGVGLYYWILTLPLLLIVDCAFDAHKLCTNIEDLKRQEYATGMFRVFSAAESCLIKNTSEFGHFWGPLCRGNIRICKKFDWFCGTFGDFINVEREKALKRSLSFVILAVAVRVFGAMM